QEIVRRHIDRIDTAIKAAAAHQNHLLSGDRIVAAGLIAFLSFLCPVHALLHLAGSGIKQIVSVSADHTFLSQPIIPGYSGISPLSPSLTGEKCIMRFRIIGDIFLFREKKEKICFIIHDNGMSVIFGQIELGCLIKGGTYLLVFFLRDPIQKYYNLLLIIGCE
ncbi:MAG: hypothetical protein J6A89_02240, partial [Clostridia bacterium]|nr:hypothetical protein [Clostridia bacterium]